MSNYRYWTTAEESYLRSNWGRVPFKEILTTLDRTSSSVKCKALELRLKGSFTKSKERFSSEELMELIDLGYHAKQIGQILGISTGYVYNLVKTRKDINTKQHRYYMRLKQNTKEFRKRVKVNT